MPGSLARVAGLGTWAVGGRRWTAAGVRGVSRVGAGAVVRLSLGRSESRSCCLPWACRASRSPQAELGWGPNARVGRGPGIRSAGACGTGLVDFGRVIDDEKKSLVWERAGVMGWFVSGGAGRGLGSCRRSGLWGVWGVGLVDFGRVIGVEKNPWRESAGLLAMRA